MRKTLATLLILFLSASVFADVPPTEEEILEQIKWHVEERTKGKIMYYTRGQAVWGHEFGCYKIPSKPEEDRLWFVFSSYNDGLKEFRDREVKVLLEIDAVQYEVTPVFIYVGTIGFTKVMYFSNCVIDDSLISALISGSQVKTSISEPKELEGLLDIQFDIFDLSGFEEARERATKMCKEMALDEE